MRNEIILFLFLSGWTGSTIAQSFPMPVTNNLRISTGVENRKENFRWSIAGNTQGKDPNILSELIFDPIYADGFYLEASYHFYKKLSLKLNYRKLDTYAGKATDFDYNEDNRTGPSVELFLQSDKGRMRDFGGSIYYDILGDAALTVKAGAGYNNTKELFYLLDDEDPKLQTTYNATWKGPGLHLNGKWISPVNITLAGGIDHYFLYYYAEANWNRIPNFRHPVSFIQRAKGNGWNYNAEIGYLIKKNISININWLYSDWRTNTGIDRLFDLNEVKSDIQNTNVYDVKETQLNGAFKKNRGWQLSATYTF